MALAFSLRFRPQRHKDYGGILNYWNRTTAHLSMLRYYRILKMWNVSFPTALKTSGLAPFSLLPPHNVNFKPMLSRLSMCRWPVVHMLISVLDGMHGGTPHTYSLSFSQTYILIVHAYIRVCNFSMLSSKDVGSWYWSQNCWWKSVTAAKLKRNWYTIFSHIQEEKHGV